MKKTYPIEVDCANCANLMEDAAKKTEGVADAVVNFMTQKMTVEFCRRSGPQDRDEGRFEELQKGRGRLRDLPVNHTAPGTDLGADFYGGLSHDEETEKDALSHPGRGGAVPRGEIDSPADARLRRALFCGLPDGRLRHPAQGVEGHLQPAGVRRKFSHGGCDRRFHRAGTL